jgi:hypothetical protein
LPTSATKRALDQATYSHWEEEYAGILPPEKPCNAEFGNFVEDE